MKKLNENGKNQILVEMDLSKNPPQLRLGADYSLEDSLFIMLEAVALLANGLVKSEKMTQKEVSEKIHRQLILANQDYEFKD